ncbi:uncharacterized protein LOC108029649 isoform X1 [Drosophila biarmipes]|uniref:uncharacterized protein LOC108029649 isoform X1 n=1 Tax=Drosophila biarmipes TaxID=125945 RepID=UPI001CDAFA71|nr:uncharacterized protein LOC108029649 isoform X1 [Drosophila biarmipes]
MLSTYHLAAITAVLFGFLQFQDMVVARVTGPVYRRPNATLFTPARIHNGGYNHSTFGPGNNNYTRAVVSPNWTVPVNHQPAFQAPTLTAPSRNRTAFVPNGWFQPNHNQGQTGTPALVYGKSNRTVYPAYNQTAHGTPYSSPYGNLSI